jgi:lathosterol oxidase
VPQNPIDPNYQYGTHSVDGMPDKAFVPGAGRITGYLSMFTGLMGLLAVLCFKFPTYLTTDEVRAQLNLDVIRVLLRLTLWVAIGTGLFSLTRNRKKRQALVGCCAALLAMALGGWRVRSGELHDGPWSIGVDWLLLDFLISASLFTFVEKLWPRYREQIILRPEWKLDLAYFALNHLVFGMLLLVANRFVPAAFAWAINGHVQAAVRSLPLPLQVLLLLVCADFVQYWIHRAYHEVPWLWKLHAVHHSVEHMDWLAGSRNHTLQILIDRTLAMVPIYLLGADAGALDAFVVIVGTQAVFIHCNVGISFGWLKYIFATPAFHHWHHSTDKPAIDTNYAVNLAILDRIFGTWHLPEGHWPVAYGTLTRLPRTMGAQLLYPFVRSPSHAADTSSVDAHNPP